MPSNIFFLYDKAIEEEKIISISSAIKISLNTKVTKQIFQINKSNYKTGSILFVMAKDDDFKKWLANVQNLSLRIAILPFEGNRLSQNTFAIPEDINEAISLALEKDPHTQKYLFMCNETILLDCANIGQTHWIEGNSLVSIFHNIFAMKLRPLEIKTAKEQELKTAALFVEIGTESFMQIKRPYFFKDTDNQCNRISSVIYAPKSITGALGLRFLLSKRKKNNSETLPKSVGVVKSDAITITSESTDTLQVNCDGKEIECTEAIFKNIPMQVEIVTGFKGCVSSSEDKESLRIQNLPTDEDMISFFSKKTLPFIPIAPESAFAELFTKIRESAKISNAYLVLLLISVLMATTGLFQNSSPTIIGAMILAPLMAPIISLSMGAVRFDTTLIRQSTQTLIFSIIISLAASALLARVLPLSQMTSQISMRTHPTLLDLAVAIFAGIAAAYGYANSKVGESLAGVAVAVALIPPLCVAGIGIGWESWSVFSNAFLLFLANIAGILLAAGAMFYFLGFASRKYVSAAFFLKLIMVALISLPLYLSTRTLITEEKIYQEFSNFKSIQTDDVKVSIVLNSVYQKKNGIYTKFSVISPKKLSDAQKNMIVESIKSHLSKNTHMILSYQYIY